MVTAIRPVDAVLPARRLLLFGIQHVLVMAASPIVSVFLVSRALNLDPAPSLNEPFGASPAP